MHARTLCLGIVALTGLARLNAQELPPPSVGGGVDIEATDGAEVKEQSHDYLPAKPYVILAERIERSVWPQVVQGLEPAAPGSRNSTFILDVSYAANHPEVIGSIRGVDYPYLGAQSRYREITLQTVWNNAGYANFELTAVSEDGMKNYRIAGTGEGRIFGPGSDGPGNLPFPRFHVSDVSATEGKVGWFTWTWGAEYRHLPGIQYYWTRVQPDGSVAVFHTNYYDLVAPGLGQFKPLGVLITTGTAGHGPKAVPTTQPLTASDAYQNLKAATWTFTDVYQPVTDAEAHYAFSPEKASASKLRYKLQIEPGLARTITWMEAFTPEGAGEPTDTQFRSENVAASATATQDYTIDPFARVGNQPGRYRVVAFESDNFDATLTADTNGDGALLPASGPMTDHVIANADAVSATQPYQLLANLDDDDSDGAPDAFDDHVNGPDDLADFFPVFLNIKSLLAALPSDVACKLSQADGALNFVYTDLKQYNAFSFRDDPWGYAYGPNFDQTAAEATVQPITQDGVPLSTDFLDRIRNDDQGVILIEARFSSSAPLVLTIETGTGVALVSLPLQATGISLAVDANRDGQIKFANEDDSDATTAERPYRFWINDDDDSGDTTGSDIPGQGNNDFGTGIAGPPGLGSNFGVDGNRDLVDWLPVFLDLKQLLMVLPPSASVKLKHAGNALSFVYTDLTRERAFAYQKEPLLTGFGFNFDCAPGEAQATHISSTGAVLSDEFLTRIKDQNAGVILVEAGAATTQPLVLVVEQGDITIAEVKLELRIGPVEEMFRHLNLREGSDAPSGNGPDGLPVLIGEISDGHEATPTQMSERSAFPDEAGEPQWLFFVHGYNVSGHKARGWNSEMFKRLYWSRSKARFVGVTWFGNPGTGNANIVQGYHLAVRNAVPTAQKLAAQLNALPGSKTVVGHSQGCWVVSVAVADYGLDVANLCLLDAAFARECFDGAGATDVTNMVPSIWQDYPSWSWSANWHQVFEVEGQPSNDARLQLTWRNRLTVTLERTAVHSFYSSTEDVLETHAGTPTQAVVNNAFRALANLDVAELGRFAWVCQEKTKGDKALFTQGSGYGGWGFNLHDGLLSAHPKWYVPLQSQPARRVKTPDEIGPATADLLEGMRHNPLFKSGWGRFEPQSPALEIVETSAIYNTGPEWIIDLYQTATGPTTAGDHRIQLLAEAIPALSLPVGANASQRVQDDREFNMPTDYADSWPRDSIQIGGIDVPIWRHSDVREVAYIFQHRLFSKLVEISQP